MVGQRLRDLREDADMTQDQLGEIVTLTKHAISSFERDINEPSDDIKIKFARFFKVSTDYLLGLTDHAKPTWDESRYLRLPADFPHQARTEAEEYVRYLHQKYNKK